MPNRSAPATKPGFLLFTRIGFAARGIMYLLVAWLALRLGRGEDAGRALDYLGSGAGRAVLGAMAVGFAAYGAWRLADAAFDTEDHGKGTKGLGLRLVRAGSGAIHLGLAVSAAKLALGGHTGGGSSRTAENGASAALSLPGGSALLIAVAAVLAVGGLVQIGLGLRRRFLRRLSPDAQRMRWIALVGIAGYCARGIVFCAAAWLFFQASQDRSASEAGGLGDALAALPGAVRAAVAAGLALFGLLSLIEARYRVIPDPKMKHRFKKAVGA